MWRDGARHVALLRANFATSIGRVLLYVIRIIIIIPYVILVTSIHSLDGAQATGNSIVDLTAIHAIEAHRVVSKIEDYKVSYLE